MRFEAKVAVLGGGVTGLCAAHHLSEAYGRTSILLLESGANAGGTAQTEAVDGFLLDWGPNGFLDREPLTLKWVEDLGLSPDLVRADAAAARRFIVKDNRLVEILPPPKFLLTPLLSVRGRARLLAEPFIPPKRDAEPETIWNFAARRIGREAADTLVSSMVSGVFGGDAKQLSLEHCFPRMAAMEREFGSLFKALVSKKKTNKTASAMGPAGTLTSFREGVGMLPREAGASLSDRAMLNSTVVSVTRHGATYRIAISGGDTVESEQVLVALPTHAAARVLGTLDAGLAGRLAQVPYADIAVVCTAFRREQIRHDLNGFGFLIPRTQGKRVLGCLWTSSIFPHEAPGGMVLLRTMLGGFTDPEAVRLSDNELLETVRKEVHPLLDVDGDPELVRIYRHAPGIPQYLLNHGSFLDVIAAAERQHRGIVFAGNAYRGVGLNDCVVSAVRAVKQLTTAGDLS